MEQQRLIELSWTILQFFLHPLLYVAIGAAILTGYLRVKRERKDFRTRLTWGWAEFKWIVKDAWILSLGISLVLALVGVLLYPEFLVLVSILAILAVILFQFQLLSAAYLLTAGVVAWATLNSLSYTINVGFVQLSGENYSTDMLWPLGLIIGLVLVAEGLLIRKQGTDILTPQHIRTNRGGFAVQYKVKRIWLLPLVLLIPGDWFGGYNTIWPIVQLGEQSFAIMAFPLITGFQQTFKRTYPFEVLPKRVSEIIYLGIAVVVISCFGLLSSWFAVAAIGIAFTGRLVLDLRHYQHQNTGSFAVATVAEGIQIAGVLEDSPAEKMGLKIGERIVKVNGQRVSNEQELYEAIQINAAHCRLEVVDHNNELRLKQHVIFRHDHHRLGLMIARNQS